VDFHDLTGLAVALDTVTGFDDAAADRCGALMAGVPGDSPVGSAAAVTPTAVHVRLRWLGSDPRPVTHSGSRRHAQRDRVGGEDQPAEVLRYLRDDGVAESPKSVHPAGNP
jgi:hypothetical protein